MDALMAQMQALSARQVALVQKGDMAGAEKLNHEMAKIQEQYKKVAEEGDSEATIAAAGKESNRMFHDNSRQRTREPVSPARYSPAFGRFGILRPALQPACVSPTYPRSAANQRSAAYTASYARWPSTGW